jgi:predicted transcriptional regulator
MEKNQKVIIMSIAPKWVDLIVNGKKKVELRRRAPSVEYAQCGILIYATAPVSAIVARCEADGIVSGSSEFLWQKIGDISGCSKSEFFEYFENANLSSAIYLSKVSSTPVLTLQRLRAEFSWHPPVAWHRIDVNSPIWSLACPR